MTLSGVWGQLASSGHSCRQAGRITLLHTIIIICNDTQQLLRSGSRPLLLVCQQHPGRKHPLSRGGERHLGASAFLPCLPFAALWFRGAPSGLGLSPPCHEPTWELRNRHAGGAGPCWQGGESAQGSMCFRHPGNQVTVLETAASRRVTPALGSGDGLLPGLAHSGS